MTDISAAASFDSLRGVLAPNLTPFEDDLSIATSLYIDHALSLLDSGCVGLVPFGTTGEALSLSCEERGATLSSLVRAGVDPARLLPGTGLANLPETVLLTRQAFDLGCLATLTLPPFFYKEPSDEGIIRYFGALLSALGPIEPRIVLYHIPQVSGVGFSIALVRQLREEFGECIAGIKDSSGDWANTEQLLDIDGLAVYPGSELLLMKALDHGAPGCITATANINSGPIAEVIRRYQHGDREAAQEQHDEVSAVRRVIQSYAPIPAQKYLLAESTGDQRWRNVRYPLLETASSEGETLARSLKSLSSSP